MSRTLPSLAVRSFTHALSSADQTRNRRLRSARLRLDALESREQPGQTTGGTLEPISLMLSTFGAAALLAPLPKAAPSSLGFLSSDHTSPPATPARRDAAEPAAEGFAGDTSTESHASQSSPSLGISDLSIPESAPIELRPTTPPTNDGSNGSGGSASGPISSALAGQSTAAGPATIDAPTTPEADQSLESAPTVAARSAAVPAASAQAAGTAALPAEIFVTPPDDKPPIEGPAAAAKGPVQPKTTANPTFAIGTDAGRVGVARVFDADTNKQLFAKVPFGTIFRGGVRVAMGDVDGDGVADLIAGAGAGGRNNVRVFSGVTHQGIPGPLHNLVAFSKTEAKGIWVAAGDVDGDGKADVIVSADGTNNSQVKIFSGADGKLLRTMGPSALTPLGAETRDVTIPEGVRVAAADVNGDGLSDVIIGTAPGDVSEVTAFDGGNGAVLYDYLPFGAGDRGGVTLAAGDLTGDFYDDVVVGHATGDTWVRVYSGLNTSSFWNVEAFPGATTGVRVAAVDVDEDGQLDLLAATTGSDEVRVLEMNDEGGFSSVKVPTQTGKHRGWFVAGDSRPVDPSMLSGQSQEAGPKTLPVVTISVNNNAVPETGGTFTITLTRDNTSGTLSAGIVRGGSAASGGDYTAGTTSAVFQPGQATYTYSACPTISDTIFEPGGEVAVINVASSANYTIGTPGSVATLIFDDDAALAPPPAADCACGGGLVAQSPGATASEGGTGSSDGVRSSDGAVKVSASDLSSGGFGLSWGIDRAWTNASPNDAETSDGNGMVSSRVAYLKTDGTDVTVITGGTSAEYFDGSGGSYYSRDYSQDSLTRNATTHKFTLYTSDGTKVVFFDFDSSWLTYQKGQLISITDPAGNQIEVADWTTNGKPAELQRSSVTGGTTTYESYLYTYIASGTNAGKLESVTERRKVDAGSWVTIRKVEYTYHDGTTSTGNLGDLKTAIVKDGSNNVLDTKYYRYYTTNGSNGFAGDLKYSFSSESYERLKAWADANSTTPDGATDAQVAVFATDYLEYDSVNRVKTHTVQGTGCSSCAGGLGTTTFSFTASTFADGYNSWRTKTVETRADGNSMTSFTNFVGQPILDIYKDTTTGQEWETYHKYDSVGRETLSAQPSAVSGYDVTKADLLNNQSGNYQYLRDSQGLISTTSYSTSTTATSSTAGNVNGYLYQTKVQKGETGTGILQSTTQYYSRTDGTITVYPVANQTQYRNADGTGGQTTSYAYTWFSGTIQPDSITTTLPAVTTAQNGSNSADSTINFMDDRGRTTWTKDQAGYINYFAYDDVTGGTSKTIQDVDTSQTSTFANLPSGWSTPSGGGLHLTTSYELDDQGRATKITDPNGNITYVVFLDSNHEQRVYPGWNSSANAPTGPTQVYREDRAHGYIESLTMSATPHLTSSKPDGTESIANIESLSRSVVNDAGQAVYQDTYIDLSGTSYSQSSVTLGTSGTNYLRTQTSYGKLGQVERTLTPSGTIYRIVSDGQGRTVSSWVGTDDTPTSGYWSPTNTAGTDLVKVAENEYDSAGVGDSLLTKTTQFPSTTSSENRVSAFSYDWRDRQIATKSGVETSESTSVNRPITFQVLDNLGETTENYGYDGDGLSITTDSNSDGVPDAPSSSYMRAKSTSSFDELGRVYQSNTYSVDPSSGSVSTNSLIAKQWYDSRGMVMKSSSPGGMVSKSEFDGVGRTTKSYVTDGGGDSAYSDADDVTSDNVLSQADYTYDADSNAIMVTSRERFHDETGTGALGTPTTGVKARVSYSTSYFDKGNRLTDSVDVGTNGGSAYTRPGTVPSRSDTVLVTTMGYNSAGWVSDVTDPKALLNKTYYDLGGRTTKAIENYVNGTVSDTDDKTVEYTYGSNGQMATLKADLTSGYQETKWVYGITSPIVSNDILKEMQYPDTSSGNASSSEKESFTYNQIGQVLTKTDRNGSVHTYSYDILGRQIVDTVTTLGSGVDGAVRRIETAYDTQGNAYLLTSYDATSAGNIVNQVQREFNGLGQLTKEWQAVSGAVNTSSSPNVQYAYSFTTSGSMNHSRLTSITYPNGRVITYNYATGLADNISRLSSITDGSTTLESYEYLGWGIVVKRGHAEPGVDLTFIKLSGESDGAAGDKYIGLDAFGRIVDQRWTTSGGTAKDRRQYGYDRDSNRLYAENMVDSTRSELYAYDGLNQITNFSRGTLNGTKDGISGTASRTQAWDFDALGNFDSQTTDGTAQTRSHNKQNEITSIASATTPTYDANGNLTKDETGRTFEFDAWNRLMVVKNSGGSTLATYRYDALGRRVRETRGSTTTDLYYSAEWQVIEERISGNATASYVWSPVYIDAMICRDRDSDSNGSLDERLYVIHDANFNVVALVDTSGSVVERFAYDAFGVFFVLTPAWGSRSSSSYAWIYLHQSGRWDADGGVYAFRHREYSPTLGRWLQTDPIGFDGGDGNLYRSLSNAPMNGLDPSGLWDLPGAIGGSIIGGIIGIPFGPPGIIGGQIIGGIIGGTTPPATPAPIQMYRLSAETVGKPVYGKYGEYSWKIKFKLNVRSKLGGYIVQEITKSFKAANNLGPQPDPARSSKFLEAFKVNPNEDVTIYLEGGDDHDDLFQSGGTPASSWGSATAVGTAVFYECLALPEGFVENNKSTDAGILPSRNGIERTGLPQQANSNTVVHKIELSWNYLDVDGGKTHGSISITEGP